MHGALGLEPLAKLLWLRMLLIHFQEQLRYISDNVPSEGRCFAGAWILLPEWMNEHLFIRNN